MKNRFFLLILTWIFIICGCSASSSNGQNNNGNSAGTGGSEKTISYYTPDGRFEIVQIKLETGLMNKKDPYTSTRFVVVNHTDNDVDEVEFSGYIYDVNGDKLSDSDWRIYDIEAGKKASSNNNPFAYCTLDQFGGIKITGYQILKKETSSSYRRIEDVLFDKKIDIGIDQMSK